MGAASSASSMGEPADHPAASKILEGALSHSGWLEEQVTSGEDKAVLTRQNPGVQAMIEQHDGFEPGDAEEFHIQTHADPGSPELELKVAEIDLRGASSPFVKDKPNDIRIRKIKESALAAASSRVQRSRELRVTLIAPFSVHDDADLAGKRATVESVMNELRDDAACCGVTLKYTDINGPHIGHRETLLRLLPLSLKAIDDSDLIVVIDGEDLLPAPGTVKRNSEWTWVAETYTNAVQQGFKSIRRHEGSTLFEMQLKHMLAENIKSSDTAIFLKKAVHVRGPKKSSSLQDTLDEMALSSPVLQYRTAPELRVAIDRQLTSQVRTLLEGVEEPEDDGSEGGAHEAYILRQMRIFIDPDGVNMRALLDHVMLNSITVVQGQTGAGKSTLLANYAASQRKADAKSGVCFHNFAITPRASRLRTVLRHVLGSLLPTPHDETARALLHPEQDIKVLLWKLPQVLEQACRRAMPRPVTVVLAGIDHVEQTEFCTGDHEQVELTGPKLFNAERCVFALQNLMPNDVLDRNKILIKPRRSTDSHKGSISPIIFDTLVDGRGVATKMIKAGAQLDTDEVHHPELQISDAETLRLGLGLVVTATRGKYGGKTEIAVADVVDQSAAERAGLKRGNVLVQYAGQSMVGISYEQAIRMLVSNSTAHLMVETEETGRQHTSQLGWLPKNLPSNCRLLVSGADSPIVRTLLGRRHCAPYTMPYFTYGHTEKLGTVFTSELLSSSTRSSKLVPRHQQLLPPDQMKKLSQGYATGTTDQDGNDMYVIAGAGVADVNGWYRLKVDKADAAKEGKRSTKKRGKKLVYFRRVELVVEEESTSPTAKLMGTLSRKKWNEAKKEQPREIIEITLTREHGVGWIIRRGNEELYVNGADSNQPPASYWGCVDGVGASKTDPPPKVYNVSKLAISRTPAQLARVVAEVESTEPCPQYYIVEGAGNDDCNGWYVRESNGVDSKTIAFYNRSSPSGRVYSLSPQKGGWYISRMGPAGLQKIYRCQRTSSSGSFEHVLPPALGWGPILDKIETAPTLRERRKEKDIMIPQEKIDSDELTPLRQDSGEMPAFPGANHRDSTVPGAGAGADPGSAGKSPQRSDTLSRLGIRTDSRKTRTTLAVEEEEDVKAPPKRASSWQSKMLLNKAKESITSKLSALNALTISSDGDRREQIPPRVRCLVAATQLPLFLRLCASDVVTTNEIPRGISQYHFHLHGESGKQLAPAGKEAFMGASIRNCTGCGDIGNLIQMRIDHCKHLTIHALSQSVRTIMYLIFCSNTGMLEEEMAELGMFPGGSKTLEWDYVFASVKPLLVCHAGRWNFLHPEIREGVNQRFTSPMVEWAYMSTVYSYFTAAGVDDDENYESVLLGRSILRQQRATEELENRERFPAGIFRSELKANGLKFEEVKLIGWAMQYNCTLTSLMLAQNRMGNRGAKLIAQGLCCNKNLLQLDLADNSIGVDGAVELARSLVINQRLAFLDLSKNRIQARGASEIGSALRHNTGLLTLFLGENGLTDGGASAIAHALQTNTSLVDLVLADNEIGTVGVSALAAAIKTNVTLHTLSLSGNDLGFEGHAAFSICLKDKSRGLANLDLSNTAINGGAMKALGEGLRDNKSIRSLDLSKNAMGDHGSQMLGEMLANVEVHHVNSSLVHINAEDNAISTAGANRFLAAIRVNGALLRLDLKGNPIDPAVLELVEDWLKINRKLSSLGPSSQKLPERASPAVASPTGEVGQDAGGSPIMASVGA